ncbi:MAG: hypothetical protein LBD12_03140, partial [Clostridiales Family XIII bacterium]|nr:hypothetical protein [Clostridiales Family XIII bacterium]
MKTRQTATVLGNEEISSGIFCMRLHAPEAARTANPGQYVNLYLDNGVHLLPRPISIADACGDELSLVYAVVGAGTAELSSCRQGKELLLLGPLGRGFIVPAAKHWTQSGVQHIGMQGAKHSNTGGIA